MNLREKNEINITEIVKLKEFAKASQKKNIELLNENKILKEKLEHGNYTSTINKFQEYIEYFHLTFTRIVDSDFIIKNKNKTKNTNKYLYIKYIDFKAIMEELVPKSDIKKYLEFLCLFRFFKVDEEDNNNFKFNYSHKGKTIKIICIDKSLLNYIAGD